MASVGDKYIIEIEEELRPRATQGCSFSEDDCVYRIKGFNSLVFDRNGLNKLEKVITEEDKSMYFKKGQDTAKLIYQKLLETPSADLKDMFPEVKGGTISALIGRFSVKEIEDRMTNYKPTFHVGEEIVYTDTENKEELIGVITFVESTERKLLSACDNSMHVESLPKHHIMFKDGRTLSVWGFAKMKRTGRSYPNVGAFLKHYADDEVETND